MFRTALISMALLIVPATGLASPPGLDDAIDAWLDEDYSQMATIATHARAGNVEAMAVHGQSLWFGMGTPKDRAKGLQYLQRAAEAGDRPSAVQLGRIYSLGYPEAPKSDALAAKYFVLAAKNGETIVAPRRLKEMPRDVVIAAGGEQWAAPAQTNSSGKPETPKQEPKPAPKPTYSQQQSLDMVDDMFKDDDNPAPKPLLAPKAKAASAAQSRTDAQMQQQADELMAALFGPSAKPAPYYQLQDGSQFPIMTDTDLSTTGDAAATCFSVLQPAMESKSIKLNELVMQMRANPNDLGLKSRASVLSTEVKTLLTYAKFANKIMTDPKQNGGLDELQTETAYRLHVQAKRKWPEKVPSIESCQRRLPAVIADIAVAESRDQYWNH